MLRVDAQRTDATGKALPLVEDGPGTGDELPLGLAVVNDKGVWFLAVGATDEQVKKALATQPLIDAALEPAANDARNTRFVRTGQVNGEQVYCAGHDASKATSQCGDGHGPCKSGFCFSEQAGVVLIDGEEFWWTKPNYEAALQIFYGQSGT